MAYEVSYDEEDRIDQVTVLKIPAETAGPTEYGEGDREY